MLQQWLLPVFILLQEFLQFLPVMHLLVIAIIGAISAFIPATIALTQNDIKRVLAYSTVSQLGYMIMALGVGAYTFAFFHLDYTCIL